MIDLIRIDDTTYLTIREGQTKKEVMEEYNKRQAIYKDYLMTEKELKKGTCLSGEEFEF